MIGNSLIVHHFIAGRVNPDQPDGIQFHTFGLARAQASQGLNANIIGVSAKAQNPERILRDGVKIITFPAGKNPFRIGKELRSFLRTEQPDIAHIQVPLEFRMNSVARFLRRLRVPYVLSTHALWSPLMLKRKRLRKCIYKALFDVPMARKALAIHATAESEAADIDEYAPGILVFAIPNAIDLSEIDAAPTGAGFWRERIPGLEAGAPLWVFLGRLDPYQKGLDALLQAWSLVTAEVGNAHLALVGSFWKDNESELRSLVRSLALQDRVHFVGVLRGAEKYAALKDASYYVQTSRFEGTPYSVLEALACRLPVVVTEGTNVGEVVREYDAGRCTPFDPGLIAGSIIELSRQGLEARSGMAVRARQLVEDRHSLKTAAEAMTRTYRELLEAGVADRKSS